MMPRPTEAALREQVLRAQIAHQEDLPASVAKVPANVARVPASVSRVPGNVSREVRCLGAV
jgi:hypothetical protein